MFLYNKQNSLLRRTILKRFLLSAVSAILLFAMTACGGAPTVTYSPSKPYWLEKENYGTAVVSGFYEKCTYTLTHTQPEKPSDSLAVTYGDSTYVTEVEATTHPATGEQCYLFTATYTVNGEYVTGEATGEEVITLPFTDVSVSKAYFNWNSGFKVISSEQVNNSTLPTSSAATTDKHGNRFVTTSYKTTVNYEEKNAVTSFEILNEDKAAAQNYFSLKDGFTSTFKKYNKSNFIDATLLAFALRSFDYADGLSYSFNTIDALGNSTQTMAYKHVETVTTSLKNVTHDDSPTPYGTKKYEDGGKYSEQIDTDNDGTNDTTKTYNYYLEQQGYKIAIGINSTYSGSGMTCTYLASEGFHHYMAEMVTTLPYGLGTMTYTLTDIQNSK